MQRVFLCSLSHTYFHESDHLCFRHEGAYRPSGICQIVEVIDFFGRILNFCRFLRGLGDFLQAFLQSAESNNLGVFLWASSLSLSTFP